MDNERKSKNNKIERYGLVKYRNVFNKCQLLESNGKKKKYISLFSRYQMKTFSIHPIEIMSCHMSFE